MLGVPTNRAELINFTTDLVQKCYTSMGSRVSFYRTINALVESGRGDGKQSRINLLYNHLDRAAANIFSPTELRFSVDSPRPHPKIDLDRMQQAGKLLTETWQNNNTDIKFATGVQEGLKYGAAILKQWVQPWEPGETPSYHSRIVMPWNFGVYSENENDLENQSALCETVVLTMPQAWQRICQLDATQDEKERLFKRVAASSKAGETPDYNKSFFRQVFSTSPLNTGVTGSPGKATPGGVVWYGNAAMGTLAPEIAVDTAIMHELWVQDADDYTTVQLIEPDILLTPRYGKMRENLLMGDIKSGLQPYTLIQMNITPGYFWGRSELTDLLQIQGTLTDALDDIMRIFGLQIDKILGFSGYDGLSDEKYDASRQAGYFNMPANAQVKDLTPNMPNDALPLVKALVEMFNMIGGTPDILQGKGEEGVRAGVHANTLLKTASPRMRQSSLTAERCCAEAADLTLSLMQAKDGNTYWTKADKPTDVDETEFHLTDLPHDRRVTVDSHSSSPIFADDHQQLVAFGLKSGFITEEGAIDLLNLPDKELLRAQLKEKQDKQQKFLAQIKQQDPEAYEKLLLKGGHHH